MPTAGEYFIEGFEHLEAGRLDESVASFTKGIALNANFAEAYRGRGFAYQRKGDSRRASEDFNKAVELKPDLAGTIHNRAMSSASKARRNQGNHGGDAMDILPEEHREMMEEEKRNLRRWQSRYAGWKNLSGLLAGLGFAAIFGLIYYLAFMVLALQTRPMSLERFLSYSPHLLMALAAGLVLAWFIGVMIRASIRASALEQVFVRQEQIDARMERIRDSDSYAERMLDSLKENKSPADYIVSLESGGKGGLSAAPAAKTEDSVSMPVAAIEAAVRVATRER